MSAIGHGRREFDWDVWFGDLDSADYLTDVGKEAARRAITDFTAFFGRGWLSRAIEPGSDGAPVWILGRFAPLLALAPARRPALYIESIRWWASIQTLITASIDGLGAIRRDVRKDLSTHRLMHTLTQARLASIGEFLGATAVLEPGKSGGPGDVLLRWSGHDLFLEVVTFGPDENKEFEDRHHHRHFLHLIGLRPAAPVYGEGDIPSFLNKADEAAWIQATTDAAGRCAQTGKPVEIHGHDGTCLVVRPGEASPGTSTRGPYVESDDASRLIRILDRKGAQTRGAGIAWIWVEDFGGVHPISAFTRMSIDAKLDALTHLAAPVLTQRPHLAGITWSIAQRCSPPVPPDAQAQTLSGAALQRALPIDRVRESVILNRHLILPNQTARVVQLCDVEPRWLDWAIAQLGITGGVDALLAQRPPEAGSRLWVPTHL